MYLIFNQDNQEKRGAAYATVPYSSETNGETVVETTEDELATIFEGAKSNRETLDGADSSIEAAIDDPLAFRDFLILDSDGSIAFDSDYARSKPDETQA